MKSIDIILGEYEDVLLGISADRSFRNIFNGPLEDRQKEGGVIWRYAIESLLGWTPAQAELYFTGGEASEKLIKALHLEKTLVPMGVEFGPKKYFDIRSVLQFAFPESVKYNPAEEAVAEYKRVAKLEEWKNNPDLHRYHRNFFKGSIGEERAIAIMDYVISAYLGDQTLYEIYSFFNSPNAKKWVRKHGLKSISQYESNNTLDLLHYTSSISNDVLYFNEKIKNTVNEYAKTNEITN